jgi:multidrug efflux pump subunit AcrA (membrane-fusion protein)
MLASIRIEDLDQLLNELEQLARSTSPRSDFFAATLQRLQFLFNATGTAVMTRTTADHWLPVAVCGPLSMDDVKATLSAVDDSQIFCTSTDQRILAVPIRKDQWQRGALVVELPKSVSEAELKGLLSLAQAFAEIVATRQLSEIEHLFDSKWLGFQRSLLGIGTALSSEECAYTIVNDLASLVQADRVSLVQLSDRGKIRTLAVSGVVKPDAKARSTEAIVDACKQTIASKKPISRRHPGGTEAKVDASPVSEKDLLGNFVAVPIVQQYEGGATASDSAILFEWDDGESFLFGCTTLNYLLPAVAAGWLQHQRWLRLPKPIRSMFDIRPQLGAIRWVGKFFRLAIITAVGLAIAVGLCMPTTLRIESEGTLEPVEQRMVFAAQDGVISRILVSDGQHVEKGESLIEMRSPMLELEIQEVLGDIRANVEKRDGLNLAVNQLSRDDPTAYSIQSRISSEIRELEIQLETHLEKHKALVSEQEKLVIRAPITGAVVARQINKFLDSRPVRRGEGLLRVVNLNGPWRLELLVRDQDSGYVKRKLYSQSRVLSGDVAEDAARQLEFAIASSPDHRFVANATWMSESARNPKGDGMYIDLIADVDQQVPKLGHMGATVYAYFDCGLHPFWFVWTRPLVETIQRKLWF